MNNKSIGDSAHANIHDALKLEGKTDEIVDFYKTWAATYDEDVQENYHGVGLIAELLHNQVQGSGFNHDPSQVKIADVGCGTGLLAKPLFELGYTNLDGIDLSKEMIEKARETGLYNKLIAGVNVHHPLPENLRQAYHAVVSLGMFTPGHVHPESLYQLAELAMPGGILVISTRIPYYEQTNYQDISDRIETEGVATLVKKLDNAPYRDDGDAHYWIYQVQ